MTKEQRAEYDSLMGRAYDVIMWHMDRPSVIIGGRMYTGSEDIPAINRIIDKATAIRQGNQ